MQLLHAKLAARDEQLLRHVQEVEEQQLTVLRRELEQRSARVAAAEEACGYCRDALAAILQSLAPQALAAAFGFSQDVQERGWSMSPAEHAALAQRLMTQRQVRLKRKFGFWV